MKNLASKQKVYTYEDYLKIDDGNRYEIIHGRLYLKDEWGDMSTIKCKNNKIKMLSAPSVVHQEIVGDIYLQLKKNLKEKKCKVFVSPIDVLFDEMVVIQPDISIVCNNEDITKTKIVGIPKVIIEVISKGSLKHDRIEKYSLYMEYGVKYYIMINPINNEIIKCTLNEWGFYDTEKFNIMDDIVIENYTISLKELFEQNPEYLK